VQAALKAADEIAAALQARERIAAGLRDVREQGSRSDG
jgi:hypothetical protein